MRYLTNILVIVLGLGMLISPLSLGAEETVETASSTDTVSNDSDIENSVVASALSASITAPLDNTNIQTGVATTFTASATGGEPSYGFLWNFGDGTSGAGANFTKTYTAAGAKTVTLTITDFAGTQATARVNLVIAIPSPLPVLSASITAPLNNANIQTGIATTFTATATGGEPPYTYIWDFDDGTTPSGQSYSKTYTAVGSRTVTLQVTDFAARTGQARITVMVTAPATPPPPPPPPAPDSLTISNIRVTDITYNSAIIHWTTNRVANSRVIYDTVSHPSITGQSAPNFGYASSTATTDADTKVTEHAVSVTNLLPSTAYYFRVLSQ